MSEPLWRPDGALTTTGAIMAGVLITAGFVVVVLALFVVGMWLAG